MILQPNLGAFCRILEQIQPKTCPKMPVADSEVSICEFTEGVVDAVPIVKCSLGNGKQAWKFQDMPSIWLLPIRVVAKVQFSCTVHCASYTHGRQQ